MKRYAYLWKWGLACLAFTLALFLYFSGLSYEWKPNFDHPTEKAFVVVIPSYNNKDWFKRNLDSVFDQEYLNYRVIYIDDASPDGTGKLVQDYVKEKGQDFRFTLIQNEQRLGSLANKCHGIGKCDPREIVVDLDGDDWLAHEEVLAHLNKIYSNPNVWVTYGQFVYFPDKTPGWAAQVPSHIIEANAFREYSWVTTALRTFYAGLFHKIKPEDFQYKGKYYPMAGDLAFMFPIIEMAGKHSRFIPEVLYVYNVGTSINDVVTDPKAQNSYGETIRAKPKYTPIDQPW